MPRRNRYSAHCAPQALGLCCPARFLPTHHCLPPYSLLASIVVTVMVLPISDLPPLIIGGAVLNTQYSLDPSQLPITDIIRTAFSHRFNAIDTSPYYGQSEELLGHALTSVAAEWPRESYFLCTKAGRIQLDEFDYSRPAVRRSVLRSLQRLGTSYLDLVYMHDIEFVPELQVFEALLELAALKREGVVRHIGVSGYPVDFLLEVAVRCKADDAIGPLDAILSYSHGCLQNTRLFDLYDRFFAEAGIKKLMNGSILSMSLLRSGVTHLFHPAPQDLKDAVAGVALRLLVDGVELADLATRFALRRWLFDTAPQPKTGPLTCNPKTAVVLGVSTVEELNAAIAGYEQVKSQSGSDQDEALYARVIKELGASHFNETWPSGRF